MSRKPSLSSASYFEELGLLTHELAALDIAVVRSEYHMAAFGSWLLEAVAKGERVRVVWDGKDSLLAFSVAREPHGGNAIQWQNVAVPDVDLQGHGDIFAASRQFVVNRLSRDGMKA